MIVYLVISSTPSREGWDFPVFGVDSVWATEEDANKRKTEIRKGLEKFPYDNPPEEWAEDVESMEVK